jgi:D-alanyl-D-alanine dipeptidase/carboxypeptidase
MKTVSLSKDAVHSGNLILVNRDFPLCDRFCGKRLVPVSEKSNNALLEMRAATILKTLMDDIDYEEQIVTVSGFRSRYEQEQIYVSSLRDNGEDFTAKYVALPGHSEHQTGLAIDLALNQPDIDALRPYFPYTGICGTFRKQAMQFGFIERYPKSKERITGIAHEPWHFRYVGAPHSRIMGEWGVTLEEYLFRLKEFPYGSEPFRYAFDGSAIEIFYLAADKNDTLFEIENNMPYTVSGNNVDGFIVTVWKGNKW